MLSKRFRLIADGRQETKTWHTMHDVCMSAFAMMFFQDPSILQFQQRMEDEVHNNNLKTLFHQIVQAAIVNPTMRQVIPLAPEEVRNTDGREKQDWETNAGKRLLRRIRTSHPKLPLAVVADSLYSKQPTIEEMIRLDMNYLLTAKPEDHKKLMEWVGEMRILKETTRLVVTDGGYTHRDEWINEVPLNDNKRTIMVNYIEYWMEKDESITYHNSWVTDLVVHEKNVREVVKAARCRWKIENETFNTLKNQGYHIEHNYGHGKKHLSFNFFLLNLLAFFMHQIFELTYSVYKELRTKFGSKRNLWDHLRTALYLIVFPDIDGYFERMLNPRGFT